MVSWLAVLSTASNSMHDHVGIYNVSWHWFIRVCIREWFRVRPYGSYMFSLLVNHCTVSIVSGLTYHQIVGKFSYFPASMPKIVFTLTAIRTWVRWNCGVVLIRVFLVVNVVKIVGQFFLIFIEHLCFWLWEVLSSFAIYWLIYLLFWCFLHSFLQTLWFTLNSLV